MDLAWLKGKAMLWNYLSGYVIIRVEGLALERFVNTALHQGIEIWNISRNRDGSLNAYVSVLGFYALHRMNRRTRYRIRIVEKHGVPVFLSRFRFRKVLLLGWVVVLTALLCASRYIWFIDIEGCDRVERASVVELLGQSGVAVGAKRRGLDLPGLARSVRNSDSRIGWAGVSLSGVVLRVNLKETLESPEVIDESRPASVYAQKAGVVTAITALNGKTQVKVGDVVQAGQLLISGELGESPAGPIRVHARGSIRAQCAYIHRRGWAAAGKARQDRAKLHLQRMESFWYTWRAGSRGVYAL